jgi:hypothetical protein
MEIKRFDRVKVTFGDMSVGDVGEIDRFVFMKIHSIHNPDAKGVELNCVGLEYGIPKYIEDSSVVENKKFVLTEI